MIYQVEIGDHANAYIITGGLTGLTEFEPTIILGDDTGVRINVDSKDDNIFTPWIKQSLEFTLIKDAEGQYDDILAGNDNETWGILIENGYLYLSEGYITISDDAVLKFKGTLALESYTEQYKQTSVVQFTFHDRIGTMEDDIFYTNTQFKNVADIFACCLSKVVCSDSLYLEWPYTLSSSDDPTEIFLDIENYDTKKKIELLEDVLHDFGLQLIVDYEVKPSINLVDAGTLVVRSVVDFVQQNVVYWGLTQTSYVSSVCGREYFTYTGNKLTSQLKTRYLLNTTSYPLINNDSSLSLERNASFIVAKNEISQKSNDLFFGTFSLENTDIDGGVTYFCRARMLPLQYSIQDLKDILDGDDFGAYPLPPCESSYGFSVPAITPYPYRYIVVFKPIHIDSNDFDANQEIKLTLSAKVRNPHVKIVNTDIRASILIFMKKNGVYYVRDYDTAWQEFTSPTQLIGGLNTITSESDEEISFNATIDSEGYDVEFMIGVSTQDENFTRYLEFSEVKVLLQESFNAIPNKVEITTDLQNDNRKKIYIENKFLNRLNYKGAGISIENNITDASGDMPLTIDYKSLSQTLLAHISDQYAWQYDGNRWNLDGTARVFNFANNMNIAGQFGLDEKILMFLNGDYDAKRKTLKGKWGQVLEVGDELYRLEKDNFDHFTWDDGNYIMLN